MPFPRDAGAMFPRSAVASRVRGDAAQRGGARHAQRRVAEVYAFESDIPIAGTPRLCCFPAFARYKWCSESPPYSQYSRCQQEKMVRMSHRRHGAVCARQRASKDFSRFQQTVANAITA